MTCWGREPDVASTPSTEDYLNGTVASILHNDPTTTSSSSSAWYNPSTPPLELPCPFPNCWGGEPTECQIRSFLCPQFQAGRRRSLCRLACFSYQSDLRREMQQVQYAMSWLWCVGVLRRRLCRRMFRRHKR